MVIPELAMIGDRWRSNAHAEHPKREALLAEESSTVECATPLEAKGGGLYLRLQTRFCPTDRHMKSPWPVGSHSPFGERSLDTKAERELGALQGPVHARSHIMVI